jgi:hypothetical protein
MTTAGLTFLSWYRQGLVAGISAAPGSGPGLDATLPAQATLAVSAAISNVTATPFDILLYGPGDVAAFDVQQVIRMAPPDGATDVETSFLPLVEFARPDLPWMMTPTRPQVGQPSDADPRSGLRPWLVLVVIPAGSFSVVPPSTQASATGAANLPILTTTADQLPDLSESWLWAHAQFLTAGTAGETIDGIVASSPQRALSRLVSPRRLQAACAYTAFVVPAFDAGRDAGLGLVPGSATLGPAWQTGTATVRLPMYFSWSFRTGAGGDFESLARKLQPFDAGAAGVRPLDIGDPGPGFPNPPANTHWQISLEGALLGAAVTAGQWPASVPQATFQAALATQVDGQPGMLPPPTYGALAASFAGALAAGQGPTWLRSLNLDPRYRTMASLGTAVVQRHQEALMASAWAQAGDLPAVNQHLASGQLARECNVRLYAKRIGGATPVLSDDRLLQMSVGVHGQVPAAAAAASGSVSVRAALDAQASLRAATTVAFRRATRPLGPLVRRTLSAPLPAPVSAIGSNAIRSVPELLPVSGQISIDAISSGDSLATLTPGFVSRPIFPWEGAAAGPGSVALPYGFMADLIIGNALAQALDFDGQPQLGWSAVTPAIGASGPFAGSATSYVDLGSFQGQLLVQIEESSNYPNENWYGTVQWISGYALEGGTRPAIDISPPALANGYGYGLNVNSISIAATDLRGDGTIDVLLAWSTGDLPPQYQGNPGLTIAPNSTYLIVGLGLNSTGQVSGGYSAPQQLGASTGPLSITAMGRQACLLQGNALTVIALDTGGNVLSQTASAAFAAQMPADFVGGAIAAAAFGVAGMDLVYCYSAGAGGQLRAAYGIAFDTQGDGSIGGWSPGLPLPVQGSAIMQIQLGAMTSAAAALRAAVTGAFRNAAASTQSRQARILALASAAQAPTTVATGAIAAQVRSALNPALTVPARVLGALQLPSPIQSSQVTDALQRAVCAPYFSQAMYKSFLELAQGWFMPSGSSMPDNRVALAVSGARTIEAFLVGLNAEMARALLWHGFPGDLNATYFDRFWDASDAGGALLTDISAVDGWSASSELGTHNPEGSAPPLVLLVRGELVRRFSHVTVYAAPAQPGAGGRTLDAAGRVDPVFVGRIDPGLLLLGFDLGATPSQVRGDGGTPGWYFVFQEHPTSPRFGLNEPAPGAATFGTTPSQWRTLDWSQVVATAAQYAALTYFNCAQCPQQGVELTDAGTGSVHRFGFSAAHMAHILFQPAVQVAIHGSLLVAPDQ